MATTFPEAPTMPVAETPDPENVDMVLVDRLPEYLKLSRGAMLLTVGLAAFFWRFSTSKLFHTDLWGHLAYGRWIWAHKALPATEPFLPVAQGVPLVDTAWLSQLLGFGLYSVAGPAGMQFLMSACVTGTLAILAYHLYQRTQRAGTAWVGMGLCLWLASQQFSVGLGGEMPALIRPQVAGVLLYTWIFCCAVTRAPMRRDWILVPLATCLWANLHGSFIMGPFTLALLSLGRGLDLLRRTGSLRAVWRDQRTVNWFLIAELSAVAALFNPYGFGLYTEVLTFSGNSNLASLLDWEPLTLRSIQGVAFASTIMVLLPLYRLSPRRVSLGEFLLLGSLGLWTMWTSRMLIWWAIPAAYYAALHFNAVTRRGHRGDVVVRPTRSGLCSVAAVGVIWMSFALTPMGMFVMHHKQPPLKAALSADTPLGAIEYLQKMKQPLRGQVFNSYEWGDYLTWAGPENMQLFVNSHVHLIPSEIWQAYLSISRGSSNVEEQLNKYGVNYVIIDHRQLSTLKNSLKADSKWRLAYEDGTATVFIRRKLI